ncbi:hypothetical protein [Streptomyces sp. CB01881]|uniref:hypothetical protein n=1 Tax=Streptomyces sp. CB01881 TaxID=2078691 RepID=UPI000CDBE6A6|nr:hypothetical protein [Streptomyces sp. CB01881]AUY50023.1 hypothetical protein C2142_15065 [Streptomyces sp. CB01881]TYC73420.1 hypothetical protein EH183_15050 [Streptomyces sp. CB01881]
MADLRQPPPHSVWPTVSLITWGLVAITVAGWLAITIAVAGFGDDGYAVAFALSPLAGPLLGGLSAWALMTLTPARDWARVVRIALTGQAALLGAVAAPVIPYLGFASFA